MGSEECGEPGTAAGAPRGPQGPGGTYLWSCSCSCLLRDPHRSPLWSRPGTDSPERTPQGPEAFLPWPG